MRKFFSLIAAVLFAGSMMAAESVVYTLDGTVTGGNNGYAEASEITQDNVDWSVMGNTTMSPWRIGGKSSNTPADRPVYSKTAIASNVTKIEIAHGTAADIEVSLTVIVASDAEFANVISSFTPEFAASETVTILRPEGADWSNAFYKFLYNVTVTQTSNKFAQLTSIKFYAEEGEVPPVEPTMDYYVAGSMTSWAANADYKLAANPGAEGEYMADFTFAANDEFKVAYSDGSTIADENWFPQGMGNNYVIPEDGEYTVYFRPEGNSEWANGYFTAIKKEAPVVTPISLTQFLADKPTEEVTLKDLTVIFATGKNTYVIDEDGVALVIYDASKTYYDGTLTAGKVLSGQKATYTQYKNQDEIIPTNAVVATDGVAPVPTLLTEKPTDDHVNRYISFKNVAAAANSGKYYIFEDVQLYGATGDLKPTADGNYDVEGLYIVYNGNTPEIIVTGLAEASSTAIDNTVVEGKAVKVVENGQLVIIKNGVRYNVLGAIVR